MKYEIIERDKTRELEADVNKRIREGWVPLGGIAVVYVDRSCVSNRQSYTQAMVKP